MTGRRSRRSQARGGVRGGGPTAAASRCKSAASGRLGATTEKRVAGRFERGPASHERRSRKAIKLPLLHPPLSRAESHMVVMIGVNLAPS